MARVGRGVRWLVHGLIVLLFACTTAAVALDVERINGLRADEPARVKRVGKIVAWNRVYGGPHGRVQSYRKGR